jgi:hypothetical protein
MAGIMMNDNDNAKRTQVKEMDDDFIEIPDQNADGYEPTDQEVQDYAEWLGADSRTDRDLFWIAKEALKAPIPPGWKLYQRKDGTGDPFYFNAKSGQSLWDHPMDQHYKELFAEEKSKKGSGHGILKSGAGTSIKTAAKPLLAASAVQSTPLGPIKGAGKISDPRITSAPPSSGFDSAKVANHRELTDLQTTHSQKIEEEKNKFAEELRIIRTKHEAEKGQLQLRCDEEIENLRSGHRKKMEGLRMTFKAEQDELEKQQNELNGKKKALEKQIADIDNDHGNKVKQLKKSHDEEIEAEKKKNAKKIADLKKQLEAEASRHESELKSLKDTNKKEEDALQKVQKAGKMKEKEQESETAELEQMRKDFEATKVANQRQYREELEKLKDQHTKEIQKLKDAHNTQKAELENLSSAHQAKIAQLKESQKAELDALVRDFEAKKSQTRSQFQQMDVSGELERFNGSLIEKKRELEARHQRDIDEMNRQHDQAVSRNRIELERIAADYQAELKRLSQDHNSAVDAQTSRQTQDLQVSKQGVQARPAAIRHMIMQSSIPLTVMPSAKGFRRNLVMSGYFAFSEAKQYNFGMVKLFGADIAPQPLHFPPSSLRPYSRLSEFGQMAPSQMSIMPSQLGYVSSPYAYNMQTDYDEKSLRRSRDFNIKLKKIHAKLQSSSESIESDAKDSLEKVSKSCQSVKSLASEQNKFLSQLTFDFQQQSNTISRTLQSAISDVDSAFRSAINTMSAQRPSFVPQPHPPPLYFPNAFPVDEYVSRRPKRVRRRVEVEESPRPPVNEENQVENSLKKWRREAKKSRVDATRIAEHFKQMKQKLDSD